jgi:translation initiation factor IF-2
MSPDEEKMNNLERPPIVTVMGHIDHGKSTLLDYIRKTNIVEGEAGGITQYLSAYEAVHKTTDGAEKKITFLDTPGHMAFEGMRSRGAKAADVAILVVSAEDGVKEQTIEAHRAIEEAGIPFVVAITKIDKPNADVERAKISMAEKGIYLEGFGGKISFVPVSAKSGEGVGELMDIVLLLAELEELKGNPAAPAEGYVIESHIDPKRGTSATMVITNGTLKRGMYVAAGSATAPARIIENFLGQSVNEITFSSPVRIIGFSELPQVGALFNTFHTREEAKKAVESTGHKTETATKDAASNDKPIIPIVVKADVLGTAEAVVGQIESIAKEDTAVVPKVIYMGVGAVSENDILLASGNKKALIVGFNVKVDAAASSRAEREGITAATFRIIYELTDWLKQELKARAPKVTTEEARGRAKILRSFSRVRDRQVVGGQVIDGELSKSADFKIIRRDAEIGRGKIVGLQQQKVASSKVEAGNQFGMQAECRVEIAPGDIIEVFELVTK